MEISNDRLEVCLNTLQLSICDSGEEKTDRPDGSHASDDFGSEVNILVKQQNFHNSSKIWSRFQAKQEKKTKQNFHR